MHSLPDVEPTNPAHRIAGDGAMKALIKLLIVRLAVWGLIPADFATWLIQRGGLNDA